VTARAPQSASWAALALIDLIIQHRILIFGSLPPHGRDLDLLVHPADDAKVQTKLRESGFVRCGNEWALFRGCSGCVVHLVRADTWNLPQSELQALLAEGSPVNGLSNVIEPSPHHSLLILARKLNGRRKPLEPKHRQRIEAALAKNPEAWKVASERAKNWSAETTLAHLKALNQDDRRLHPQFVRRPRRTRIVSLSGLDGAGKSSQASFLRDTLGRLGLDAVVEWGPANVVSLRFLSQPIRKVLGYDPPSTVEDSVNPDLRPSAYPSSLAHVWVTIVASAAALSLWRVVWRHLGRGRIVICDRYILDFAVFLDYRHGATRDFSFQKWLLRALSPKAVASYLLDVTPEAALGRKEEQYTLAELRRQAELYRANSVPFGVGRLNGERSFEAICEDLATKVWQKLRRCPTTDPSQ